MTAPDIPDEALEAAAVLLWHRFAPAHHMEWENETHAAEYRDVARAACLAMLRSWPGMTHGWKGDPQHYKGGEARIILPLPQEPRDAAGK